MKTISFGSLFAGVGGFDLGLEAAGWVCGFQVEWDKNCLQTLQYHWPNVPKWGDVSDVNGADLPPVDVITFGSPCQDLSVAGKRAGLEGDRSGLFHQAIRIIKEMREATNGNYPTVAIWENVPGALSSRNGNDFARVLTEMADLGAHTIEWAVLDAQYFRVPQRRRRVYVVALLGTATPGRDIAPIFDLPEGCRRNTKTSRGTRETTTADFKASARADSGDTYVKTVRSGARDADGNLPPEVWQPEPTAPTLNSFDNGGESRATVLVLDKPDPVTAMAIPIQDVRNMVKNQNGLGIGEIDGPSYTLDGSTGTGVAIPIQGTLIGRSDTAGPQGQGIGEIDGPSYTLDGASRHGVAQGLTVRRLTPVECERLQGWPDNHTLYRADGKTNPDSTRYKMTGNGVAAPVAKWIAEQLNRLLLSAP